MTRSSILLPSAALIFILGACGSGEPAGAGGGGLDAAAIAFILEHGGAKVLFTDREFSPIIAEAWAPTGLKYRRLTAARASLARPQSSTICSTMRFDWP